MITAVEQASTQCGFTPRVASQKAYYLSSSRMLNFTSSGKPRSGQCFVVSEKEYEVVKCAEASQTVLVRAANRFTHKPNNCSAPVVSTP